MGEKMVYRYFGLCIAVMLLILAALAGCGRISAYQESKAQASEEARQQLIQEMGEENRARNEKRQAFLHSPLHEAGMGYLRVTLEELMPGCKMEISLEPGDYRDAAPEELEKVPENMEEWAAFFSRASLSFNVNHWDYKQEPEEICEKLMERGISGNMNADEWNSDRWYFRADTGETELYRRPGV